MGVWIETRCLPHLPAHHRSHPVWVCGLKLYILRRIDVCDESHPVWVCGLKQRCCDRSGQEWKVTPCMGVWIETYGQTDNNNKHGSHPVWVCGLKRSTL